MLAFVVLRLNCCRFEASLGCVVPGYPGLCSKSLPVTKQVLSLLSLYGKKLGRAELNSCFGVSHKAII